jgi:hypothetical protein
MNLPQFDNFLSTFGNREQRLREYMGRYWQNTVYEELTKSDFSDESMQKIIDLTEQRLRRPHPVGTIKKAKTAFKNFYNKN